GEFGRETLVGLAVVQPGNPLLPCLELYQHLRKVAVRSRAADQRHVRGALENLLALLLRYAAQHSETLTLLVKFFVVGQAMKDLLLGFVANGTGVVKNQTSLFDRGHLAISLSQKGADNLLRIVH